MSTLSINAHLKFIEFLLHELDDADDSTTVGVIRSRFSKKFDIKLPVLLCQDWGIVRLVPLLLMREFLKNEKVATGAKYKREIDIVRHSLAHDSFAADSTGYKFTCDKGTVNFSYDEFVAFLYNVENEFYSKHSEHGDAPNLHSPSAQGAGGRRRAPGMAHDLQGESPFNHLSGGRFSEGQRRRREAGSEGSLEQSADPTNRNCIRGTGAG